MSITWDEWRGSMDGRPTLWIKRLAKLLGCRVDLHKMIAADDEGCFHTHPAHAIRIILRGGYIEELAGGDLKFWYPGMIGLVRPTFCHRIEKTIALDGGPSFSLWIRFRVTHKVELHGDGWSKQEQTHRVPDTVEKGQTE